MESDNQTFRTEILNYIQFTKKQTKNEKKKYSFSYI